MPMEFYWIAILICLLQSGLLSGLTLGLLGFSRLRLETLAESGDQSARKILHLRKDAHLLLATLIWGNVSVNVLLTMMTDSVLSGVAAFSISTLLITFGGEILPQAFFSHYALKAGAVMVPFVKFYRIIFYPVAKPTALLLDKWLGKEGITYFQEAELEVILKKHGGISLTDIGKVEAIGAANFLALDDILVKDEGEAIEPESIIALAEKDGQPVFPKFKSNPGDNFLRKVDKAKKKWVILTSLEGKPLLVLNAHYFLRAVFMGGEKLNPYSFCHRPILVTDPNADLEDCLVKLRAQPGQSGSQMIEHDLILFWGETKKIITGADILGRILRGIAKKPT